MLNSASVQPHPQVSNIITSFIARVLRRGRQFRKAKLSSSLKHHTFVGYSGFNGFKQEMPIQRVCGLEIRVSHVHKFLHTSYWASGNSVNYPRNKVAALEATRIGAEEKF